MSAHANVIQVNDAAGRNIHQSQNADVNVVAQSGSHHNPHWYGHNQGHEYGHHGHGHNHHGHGHNHHGHNHHGHNHGADAQANVIQVNQASGNNIHQSQNADVNVVAHGNGGHHAWGRHQADHADAQVNVIQANQASGNNIHQAQNADVNVHVQGGDAFHGHNSWAPMPTHYDAGYAGHGQGYVGGYEHGSAYDSGAYQQGGEYGYDVSILPINPGC